MDITNAYSDLVEYTKYLETLLKELTSMDDSDLLAIRKQHIKPVTNVAVEWLKK